MVSLPEKSLPLTVLAIITLVNVGIVLGLLLSVLPLRLSEGLIAIAIVELALVAFVVFHVRQGTSTSLRAAGNDV